MMTMVVLPRVTLMMTMTMIQMIQTAVIKCISPVVTKGSRCAFSSLLLQLRSSPIKHRHRQTYSYLYWTRRCYAAPHNLENMLRRIARSKKVVFVTLWAKCDVKVVLTDSPERHFICLDMLHLILKSLVTNSPKLPTKSKSNTSKQQQLKVL